MKGFIRKKTTESVTDRLKAVFSGDMNEYRSLPFWSWNNLLDKAALVGQIEEMKKAGMGGFIMHARTGLKTEYLGEEWFACVEACLDKAAELGMRAWIYDENGWPSGFAGGKLLEVEKYRARFLEYEVRSAFDPAAFCVYVKADDGYKRVDGEESGIKEYHTLYLRISPSHTDILDPEVTEAFLRETHEKYYARFGSRFGKELAGFFTDEPQYYRWATPYPVKVADEFVRKYGEDVKDGLIYLFLHDERGYSFRYRYFCTLSEMYMNTYYKRLYEWCSSHGCLLTGHSVEEPRLYTQMWGGAGVMPTYEYEHIPGVDSLGRKGEYFLSSRQVGSAAAQLGKKFVLTEIFGAGGYDVTPAELKHSAEMQYFNGVNLMCQHLLPYSVAGQGKHDCPPVFYKQNNWWEEFAEFNEYFTRLGYVIANTDEQCDALVIHPMRSVYLEYVRSEDGASVSALERSFENLLGYLNSVGVTYQLADETLLAEHGRLEDGFISIGKCRYNTVIVPDMPDIARSTLDLLSGFRGKLCMAGRPEYVDGEKTEVGLVPDTDVSDLVALSRIKFTVKSGEGAITSRKGDIGEFLFIKNQSLTEPMTFTLDLSGENYIPIDLLGLTLGGDVPSVLGGGESLIMVKAEPSERVYGERICDRDVTGAFSVVGMSENVFVSDVARLSFDGIEYGEPQPLVKIFENLLYNGFSGRIFIKHEFFFAKALPTTLVLEKYDFLSVGFNGEKLELRQSDFDVNFVEADVGKYVVSGKNEYVYSIYYKQRDEIRFAFFDPRATESMRNRLYYDAYIEPVYLKGDFVVSKDGKLYERKEYPAVSSALYKNGYPFFYGSVTLKGNYEYDGESDVAIIADGRYVALGITVDGKEAHNVFGGEIDVTRILKKGVNELTVTVKSSLRNLFGPHHLKGFDESCFVGSEAFTLYGSWKDGFSEMYDPEYNLVPFGVDKLTVRTYRKKRI